MAKVKEIVEKYTDVIDMNLVNKMLQQTTVLNDFQFSKKTLKNIASWALDGKSNDEIRANLELTPRQWSVLVNVCPALIVVMDHSRSLADTMIAGSLFQTAIGGKVIRKQQPVKVKDYNEDGRVIGEHIEIAEYDEELPPNAYLLKFLAENKLSENFGKTSKDMSKDYRNIIETLTPEEQNMIALANKEVE